MYFVYKLEKTAKKNRFIKLTRVLIWIKFYKTHFLIYYFDVIELYNIKNLNRVVTR
jgi:hypothetical protein